MNALAGTSYLIISRVGSLAQNQTLDNILDVQLPQ